MIKKNYLTTSLILGVISVLYGCGGGGSTNDGSIDTSEKSSSGPITSFGSIYVNGKRYDTSNSEVYVEDSSSDESELRVGMMVNVVEDDSGNAASVYYDDDLEGIVSANNITAGSATGTIEVMGQTVTVDNKTVFDTDVAAISSIDLVVAGNIVEVSGYNTSDSTIMATRIEVKAVDLATYLSKYSKDIEVKGIVTEHSASSKTFKLGSLVVNYAGAILDDLANGIQNELYVEVKSTQGMNASDQLIASKVELEDNGRRDYTGDDGDEYEVKGYVTALSADSITVNEETFIINSGTEFEDGSKDKINVGDMVEVEGSFNSEGSLVAKEVELEDSDDSNEIKGTVASVTIDNDNNGTITLLDNTVIKVTNSTLMHDERDEGFTPDKTFNLADISSGDYIEVYAIDNGDGTFTATKIEREDTPSS